MRRWLIIGIPIVIIIGFVFMRISAEKASAAEMQKQQQARRGASPAVQVAMVERKPLITELELLGNVEAPYNVDISPRVSGRIEYLQVREGDTVRPGQVLVRLDPSDLTGQVLEQRASVSEARSRYAEAAATQGSANINIETGIDAARANLESAQADLNQADKTFDAQVAAAKASVLDADARVKSANSDVANAKAQRKAAQASLANAKARYERLANLAKQGYIAGQEVEDARTRVDVEEGNVAVAEGRVDAAESSVESAKAQKTAAQERAAIVERQATADVAAAKAKVKQAQAALKAATANRAQTPAYRENLAALKANINVAEAQLRQAQAKQTDTVLKAPIEGTVTRRAADPGTVASPGNPVLTIQYLKWVYVTASVPPEQASAVYVGKPASVFVEALNKTFQGKIESVNRAADLESRRFDIRIRLDNMMEEIRPGMFAKVKVETSRTAPQLVVPRTALRKDGPSPTVAVVNKEGKAEIRKVEVASESGDLVALKSGVEPGEQVVILSYSPVREGQTVKLPGQEGSGGGGGQRRSSGGRS